MTPDRVQHLREAGVDRVTERVYEEMLDEIVLLQRALRDIIMNSPAQIAARALRLDT